MATSPLPLLWTRGGACLLSYFDSRRLTLWLAQTNKVQEKRRCVTCRKERSWKSALKILKPWFISFANFSGVNTTIIAYFKWPIDIAWPWSWEETCTVSFHHLVQTGSRILPLSILVLESSISFHFCFLGIQPAWKMFVRLLNHERPNGKKGHVEKKKTLKEF